MTLSATTPSRSLSRLPRRRFLIAAGILGGGAAAIVAWFLRDPEPIFAARRGALVAVDSASPLTEGEVRETRYRLTGSSGLEFELAVREPIRSPGPTVRRTLFLILGGHKRGAAAGALLGDTRGAIVASLAYPFAGNADAKGVALLAEVPAIRRALYDTPPAVSLALDHLLARSDVDPGRVELVGASFGAPFATIAAARDPRVSRLWLAHGGGRPLLVIERGLEREIGPAVLRWPVALLADLLASGPRFAPERWIGRVAPRPVVMLNALEDERVPRESVDALWAAAREPREMVWLPGQHMMGSRPEVLRALVDSVMVRAARSPR